MSGIGTTNDLLVPICLYPNGRVAYIEDTTKAINNNGTIVGIKCKDGIVLGAEKPNAFGNASTILKGYTNRIFPINNHIAMAISGLVGDGMQIITRARATARNYINFCCEEISTKELCDKVARLARLSMLSWWRQSFGTIAIMGGYHENGPQLFVIESSRIAYGYSSATIGKGHEIARMEIDKLNLSQMTCREGVIAIAKIFCRGHDKAQDREFGLEMSWICEESKQKLERVPLELLVEANEIAKATLE